jgi:DNA-binding MarR family transcriptional regulator
MMRGDEGLRQEGQEDAAAQARVASLVFQVFREQRNALDRKLAAFDLTAQQGALLLLSWLRPRLSPGQLAARLGTDNAGMTRLVDRLEAKGLVARRNNPADRRSIVIEPTAAGRALRPRVAPVFASLDRQLLAGFSAEETARLKAMLRRLLANLREQAE